MAATGIDVDVRYGSTAELAGLIMEEGDASPADAFWAQDAGATDVGLDLSLTLSC